MLFSLPLSVQCTFYEALGSALNSKSMLIYPIGSEGSNKSFLSTFSVHYEDAIKHKQPSSNQSNPPLLTKW